MLFVEWRKSTAMQILTKTRGTRNRAMPESSVHPTGAPALCSASLWPSESEFGAGVDTGESAGCSPQGKRVLVLDGDRDQADGAAALIRERTGCEVCVSQNVASATEVIGGQQPDLVLLGVAPQGTPGAFFVLSGRGGNGKGVPSLDVCAMMPRSTDLATVADRLASLLAT
jgi:hypothetical protein